MNPVYEVGVQRDDRVNDHADRSRVEQRQHMSRDAGHDGHYGAVAAAWAAAHRRMLCAYKGVSSRQFRPDASTATK
jgi:hypothetical protein